VVDARVCCRMAGVLRPLGGRERGREDERGEPRGQAPGERVMREIGHDLEEREPDAPHRDGRDRERVGDLEEGERPGAGERAEEPKTRLDAAGEAQVAQERDRGDPREEPDAPAQVRDGDERHAQEQQEPGAAPKAADDRG